jgi:hypothetical protein
MERGAFKSEAGGEEGVTARELVVEEDDLCLWWAIRIVVV